MNRSEEKNSNLILTFEARLCFIVSRHSAFQVCVEVHVQRGDIDSFRVSTPHGPEGLYILKQNFPTRPLGSVYSQY